MLQICRVTFIAFKPDVIPREKIRLTKMRISNEDENIAREGEKVLVWSAFVPQDSVRVNVEDV